MDGAGWIVLLGLGWVILRGVGMPMSGGTQNFLGFSSQPNGAAASVPGTAPAPLGPLYKLYEGRRFPGGGF